EGIGSGQRPATSRGRNASSPSRLAHHGQGPGNTNALQAFRHDCSSNPELDEDRIRRDARSSRRVRMKNERTTTLEDVLDLILSEEQEPSHEALLRWCKEYPEHAEALTRFFATWAVQNETVGEPELDEARIGNLLVSHALDIIHRQKTSCAEAGSKA